MSRDPEFWEKISSAQAETPGQRLEDAIELCELIGEIAAAAIRRDRPNSSEEEIAALIVERSIASQERSYRK